MWDENSVYTQINHDADNVVTIGFLHIPFTFSHHVMNWKYNLMHFKQQFVLQRMGRICSYMQPGGKVCTVYMIWQLFLWENGSKTRHKKWRKIACEGLTQKPSLSVLYSGTGLDLYLQEAILV